jgi:aspartate kinase
MKFGGSSVGDAERMIRVAKRIVARKQQGNQCVVVVSAMGDSTDELIDLSKKIFDGKPPTREMDMLLSTGEQVSIALLSMAIHNLGEQAVSFTGWQAGMLTEEVHGNARISVIKPVRVMDALANNVVIVAGFQGMTETGEITTLGRGGSDTTAVAMAAAIKADVCEIYTDVDGIYTTDPRVVKVARKLEEISYDEMLELAHLGAAVLHPRAVEYAKHNQVALVVRSSFNDNEGTQVKEEVSMEQGMVVRGIASDKDVARISIIAVPEKPGQLATVFTALAKEQIDVDIIVQSGVQNGSADFSFTVSIADIDKVMRVLNGIQAKVGFKEATSEVNLVKVSIVGAGMVSHPGVAATMFETISALGISINMVSTSEIKMSCVINNARLHEVINALHSAYGLDAEQQAFVGGPSERR